MLAPVLVSVDKLSTGSIAGAYTLVWLLVSTLLYLALHRSLAKMAKARGTKVSEVLAATVPRSAAIAVFLIGIASGLRLLRLPGSDVLELHKLVAISLGIVGVAVLMRIGFRSIDAFGRSNPDLRSSAGIGRAVTWVVGLAIVAVLVSDALGISLAPALTALGVGSLSVALALQDTLSNFFAGVYIIFDKPVRPGDYIRIDPSYDGYVETIGWRSTHLKTMSNNLVVIPNATLSKAIITNYTLPTPSVASSVRVDVVPGADVDKVEDALADEARRALDLPGVAKAPEPSVLLTPGFVDGGIAFTIFFHVSSFGEQGGAQHALRKRVAARLKKEGIALASASLIVRREQ
jgi:small-conductance mechanosensitive channel